MARNEAQPTYSLLVRDDDQSDWRVILNKVSHKEALDARDKWRCHGIRFSNMSIQKVAA